MLIHLLVSSIAVFVTAWLLPGVEVDGFMGAILVAIILGLLNTLLKPVLIILTIPITLVTLGLFLLVVNAAIILLADKLLDSFMVNGFWWALLFSLILSAVTSILERAATKQPAD